MKKQLLKNIWIILFAIQIPSYAQTLTSPNGGENWIIGNTYDITWTGFAATDSFDIGVSLDYGFTSYPIATNIPASDGSYSWTIPNLTPSAQCLISLSNRKLTIAESSDLVFTISTNPSGISLEKDRMLADVYPNPASEIVTVKLKDATFIDMKFYDIEGRSVKTIANDSRQMGKDDFAVDISALKEGIYYYKLLTDKGIVNRKLIIAK